MIPKQYFLITLLFISTPILGMEEHKSSPKTTKSIGTQTTPEVPAPSRWGSIKRIASENAWEFGSAVKSVAMTALAGYVFGKVFPEGGKPVAAAAAGVPNLAKQVDIPASFTSSK